MSIYLVLSWKSAYFLTEVFYHNDTSRNKQSIRCQSQEVQLWQDGAKTSTNEKMGDGKVDTSNLGLPIKKLCGDMYMAALMQT